MPKRRGGTHRYPRTARLKELFREILAEELERIDDDRLDLVTVIEVDVDSSLDRAVMYFVAPHDPDDPDAAALDAEVLQGLDDHRKQLRQALGQQARIKRVPELIFKVDQVMDGANRIEDILRELPELQGDRADESEPGLGESEPGLGEVATGDAASGDAASEGGAEGPA